ncbi:DUF5018 domain-containing protein [Flagellimonas sp. HMM57]|uniref:Kelch repeat-containing protein n=1 Tax=unclassified Flagellimonas TaxID=2644544 RepID=UPI0013D3CC63|nr:MULTISPECIES: kelch repeat-containing protein [unclassified Flagellimonas]UII76805.1 DUF5018 domain-containing protein [Flagellimonas sp. HMM57]
MKRKVLLLSILYLFVSACSKDDDKDTDSGADKSDAKEITSFSFLASDNDGLAEDTAAVIDEGEKTVTVTLPSDTVVTSLRPNIEVSQGATIDPENKVETDFSDTVEYTVTAEDGSTAVYKVKINVAGWDVVTPEAAFLGRRAHSTVVFDGKLWVMGGSYRLPMFTIDTDDVWYSEDGITWTEATDAAAFGRRGGRADHTSVTFDDKLWVIGGQGEGTFNDVWYSEDGITWTEATGTAAFSKRTNHGAVVFDNKLWVIGGYNGEYKNDVWYSEDGITWTEATDTAAFSERRFHTTVVFDDRIWVIGGYDGNDRLNDVWYSEDGITWTEATGAAAFGGRYEHTSVVFDDRLWVIGGYNGEYKNDVWYSEDGITWTEATGAAAFSRRYDHTSVVFDDRIWVIGGYDGDELNDVWAFGIE